MYSVSSISFKFYSLNFVCFVVFVARFPFEAQNPVPLKLKKHVSLSRFCFSDAKFVSAKRLYQTNSSNYILRWISSVLKRKSTIIHIIHYSNANSDDSAANYNTKRVTSQNDVVLLPNKHWDPIVTGSFLGILLSSLVLLMLFAISMMANCKNWSI